MNPIRVLLAVILVNAAGITLRYFDLTTYFIFLGFRFHLSSVFPFLFLMNEEALHIFYGSFTNPQFRKKFLPLLWIIASLAILLSFLFLLNKIKPGDPDYFYEFGLSSVFDFPLYLIWNFPQLCLLFYTLLIFSSLYRFSYINVFIGLILLFGYELIPLDSSIVPVNILPLVFLALIASFFVTRLQNIYWFAIVVFSSLWSVILLFGSKSELIINIFFAKEYSSWEGFFNVSKEISLFMIPAFFLFLLLFTAIYTFSFIQKS